MQRKSSGDGDAQRSDEDVVVALRVRVQNKGRARDQALADGDGCRADRDLPAADALLAHSLLPFSRSLAGARLIVAVLPHLTTMARSTWLVGASPLILGAPLAASFLILCQMFILPSC